jgi:ketosteroid isomerase-like protein
MTQPLGDGGIVVAAARSDRAVAIDIAREFMDALAHRDLQRAASFLARDFVMTISGGHRYTRLEDFVSFSATRYASVRKQVTTVEACEASNGVAVYLHGDMQGSWPDGTAFEARFCDRFLLREAKLVELQTWSDAAEHARRNG